MPDRATLAVAAARLAAQCAGGEECPVPRSLPWFLIVAAVAAWAVLVFGVVTVARHRRRLRAERRRQRAGRRRGGEPGTELERL